MKGNIMADSTALKHCALCGVPLDDRELDRGTCHDCRSPKGKIADLDIAIRASGNHPERIGDWPWAEGGLSFGGLVSEDETALQGCADWLRSIEIAVGWLFESLGKCRRAEALTPHKQTSAMAELRDSARKLSDILIEGEVCVGAVTAPIAHRMREEMHALQDPLIAIFGETPSGFASWGNILDENFDALLAALEGLKAEGRHVATLIATALEAHRRKQLRESEKTNAEAATTVAREAEPAAGACPNEPAEATAPTKTKRSTERGEGRAKLIAALTKHHQYADGGCLNMEPVGNNELARLAAVSESTASAFFDTQFNGHAKYRAKCQDAKAIACAIKAIRGEFTPAELKQMTSDAFEAGKQAADDE